MFNEYLIIKKCDLSTLFNLIDALKQDVIKLSNDNQELKNIILNNIGLPGNDSNTNNNINDVGHDAPDKTEIQDTLINEFNLSLINDQSKPENKKRYYYKSHYLFYANPKYYKLLNLKFNELMSKHKNEPFNKIKQLLKAYLLELEAKDI